MARVNCVMRTGPISLVAANGIKTLVQILAPTNQGIALTRATVSFEGTAPTDKPNLVQLMKQTTAGTGGLSTITPKLKNSPGGAPTIQTSALYGLWATTEPTSGDILDEKYVHPQSGYEWVWQRGQDEIAGYNVRYAIVVTPGSGNATCNAIAAIEWEE